VIDVATHEVLETVPLGDGNSKPVGVAVSPDSRTVYVANGAADCVSVVDASTHRVRRCIPVGRRPWGIAVSPDGRWVYTANGLSNSVSVIDTRSSRTVATIAVGSRPWGVAVARTPPSRPAP
jgi:YVTN family beta-propeller protein